MSNELRVVTREYDSATAAALVKWHAAAVVVVAIEFPSGRYQSTVTSLCRAYKKILVALVKYYYKYCAFQSNLYVYIRREHEGRKEVCRAWETALGATSRDE